MIIKAPAKINLGLDVLGLRQDGYHEVKMVMQMLKLHDELTIEALRGGQGITLTTNVSYIPTDGSNLAVRAAALLMEEFDIKDGLTIFLQKNIPVAAGLAGGSTDAAAVLIGLNKLYKLGLGTEELMARGVKLGADVPFCVMKTTALSEGIGEVLTPVSGMPTCGILLAKPPFSVSTPKIYKAYDSLNDVAHPDVDAILQDLENGDLKALAGHMGNVLEAATGPMYPVIGELEKAMKEAGALNAMMSGSGPTVFGIYNNKEAAAAAKRALQKQFPGVRLIVTEPLS
ncbi:MAG: 4-(cytidine 5'-diphospho)-2-C-methyl-D-erythritol kinase [Lachnospiraceae bacterium]|nr:4-(cytidine 5'-diphospho)-2-C-methyl-D-erythritol kinase [Lachnospiraceae bacterium]